MIKKLLKEDKKNNKYSLKGYVLSSLLNIPEKEIKGFIGDVLKNGCVSGIVSELIYYKDTIKFYDKYENEIEDLISQNMDNLGIDNRNDFIKSLNGSSEDMTQQKNLLSWFAYEEVLRQINEEFKINEEFI